MSRFKFFEFIICFGFVICYFVFSHPVNAQSSSLSVSPPVVEILLAPNKQLKQTFTLKAEGRDLSITPTLHRLKPRGNTGQVEIDLTPLSPASIPLVITSSLPLGTPYALNQSTGEFTLTLTFSAPTLDVATDLYLALVFKTATTSSPSISTATSPAISALILASINPTGIMAIDLDIIDFDTPLLHDTWLPLHISPALQNNEDLMLRPEGTYEIIAPSGKTLFSLPLYPNLILGESSRLLQGTEPCNDTQELQGSVPCNPPTSLSWSPSWYHLGPHRLNLTITTQGGTKLTQVERIIWLLPIRLLLIILAISLLLLTLYLRHKRHSRSLP